MVSLIKCSSLAKMFPSSYRKFNFAKVYYEIYMISPQNYLLQVLFVHTFHDNNIHNLYYNFINNFMTMNKNKFVILVVRVTFYIQRLNQYIVYFMITSKTCKVNIHTN